MSAKYPGKSAFTKLLLQWNELENQRQMPWKGEKDPYKIWLSEVILQQTRVEQGWAYYNRFIQQYHTIHDLANAPETEVFKLWEGLGYYSRCKNLMATAKYISTECKGIFPNTYPAILQLSGIGPYTAAAIASFAFDLPHAVVDGNVYRVLSRYFAIDTPIDSPQGKLLFQELAQELLHLPNPAVYNQAMMDFGATVCKPKSPVCTDCPLAKKCQAFELGLVANLPVKSKKLVRKSRWFNYVVIRSGDRYWVRKRTESDIWANLYEFVLVETPEAISTSELMDHPAVKSLLGKRKATVVETASPYLQQLTHQTIHGQFVLLEMPRANLPEPYRAATAAELSTLPFPKFLSRYLQDNFVSLNLL